MGRGQVEDGSLWKWEGGAPAGPEQSLLCESLHPPSLCLLGVSSPLRVSMLDPAHGGSPGRERDLQPQTVLMWGPSQSSHFAHRVSRSTPCVRKGVRRIGRLPQSPNTEGAEGGTQAPGMPAVRHPHTFSGHSCVSPCEGAKSSGPILHPAMQLWERGDTLGLSLPSVKRVCGGRQPKTAAPYHHLCAIVWKGPTEVGSRSSPCWLSPRPSIPCHLSDE